MLGLSLGSLGSVSLTETEVTTAVERILAVGLGAGIGTGVSSTSESSLLTLERVWTGSVLDSVVSSGFVSSSFSVTALSVEVMFRFTASVVELMALASVLLSVAFFVSFSVLLSLKP